jgi:hypothetical protein
MPDMGEVERRKMPTTVLVRCWSDADDYLLLEVESFSAYQAADDARGEYPGYAYYDPVRVLSEPGHPIAVVAVEPEPPK